MNNKILVGYWFASVLILGYSIPSQGQYGNEWINYNQSYYKIPIIKNGIHRLTYDDLSSAGVPVNFVDPRRIQIFRRGQEQAINFVYLQLPANGVFEPGEYLEFYGEKNDGATDVDLYKNPLHHPHPYYNLYSDTAAYFLTWNLLPVQGKRMPVLNPEINVGGLPLEPAFKNVVLQLFSDQYSAGYTYGGRVQNSFFDEGEGWTGFSICTLNSGCTGQQDFVVNIPKGVTTQSPPQLELLVVGRGEVGHSVEVYAGQNQGSLRLVATSTFQDFQLSKISTALQWTDVASDGSLIVRVKGLGVGGVRESISVSYLKVDYLRDFNFAGIISQSVQLLPRAGGKSYIEIQNAPSGLRLFDIMDQNYALIGTYNFGANLAAVVSNTSSARKIFATNEFFTPTIKKVFLRPINPALHNYIIISHPQLRKAALGYSDPVEAYADYRASTIGGSFDTLVVNMDQLYNQFNYGETSPRSIYQFMKFMVNGGDPKYLFLIGKGLELNFTYDRKRVFTSTDLKDLVPTAGYPGSDVIFTSGLNGTTVQNAVPTGRLTVNSATEVASYLNKIKEAELLPFDALWRKNILHLSGGINPGEPEVFRIYVNGFADIAKDVFLGAHVETKSKRTFDLETVPIADQVNAGLSLITFFGHSSTATLDFDIGNVTNPQLGYNNPGKYPVFLINGCNVGRVYDNRSGTNRPFGEDWITAQNKGAKAFIAHCSFGFENNLQFYSDIFYKKAFADSVGLTLGIGDIQKQVADQLTNMDPNVHITSQAIMQQMVLNGDPAVKLFGAPKPDYAIQDNFMSKVSFDGKPVTASTQSFGVKYKIQNYGQAREDSIHVSLTRTFSNNTTETYDTLISPVFYENEFVFIVLNPNNEGGQNSFTIKIDGPNELEELSEINNEATYSFFIPSSSTYNLVPYPYSIVKTTSVELIFQNTNQTPMFREYQLELDTVATFNSPFLIQKKVSSNVLGRVDVSILSTDHKVYYWRTKLDAPTANESPEWFTTSFSYAANDGIGWAQMRPSQISENIFDGLKQNASGTLAFPEYVSTVFVLNFGSANTTPYTSTSIKVNNEELNIATQGQPCRSNTINLVAFNRCTGNAYPAIPFNFQDPRTCGREPQVINSFTAAEAELGTNGLVQAITNIGVNDSVVFFSIGNSSLENFSPALITKLGEVGISPSQLSGFSAGEPIIFFGRKGASIGEAKVIRSSTTPVNEQELVANETVTAFSCTGKLTTQWIGPAKEWYHFTNQIKSGTSDVFIFKIIGLTADNVEEELYEGSDSFVNLAFIDPIEYPKLKLELSATDDTDLTPVDIKNWVLSYEPVAEGILLFRGNASPMQVQEGEGWSGRYAYINLTDKPFYFLNGEQDLSVDRKIFNQDKSKLESQTIQITPPAPLDSTVFNWDINSLDRAGINDLGVYVNRNIAPEQYVFNNQILLDGYLNVIADHQPPVLAVTVDGRYLMNGDVVSSEPTINIKILDENVFRFKTDTLGVQILIKDINTDISKRINFSDPKLTWSPASATEDFNISYQAELILGEYQLSVQGVDASGNRSGETPYTVTFTVSDELSVQIGPPFPNPSTSSFTFPIRLAGNELPEAMTLKIFSPDGRLIRNFGLDDVSGFFVGINFLKWNSDGLDAVKMPNGLYYFKLELIVAGEKFSKAGRLVLIR